MTSSPNSGGLPAYAIPGCRGWTWGWRHRGSGVGFAGEEGEDRAAGGHDGGNVETDAVVAGLVVENAGDNWPGDGAEMMTAEGGDARRSCR